MNFLRKYKYTVLLSVLAVGLSACQAKPPGEQAPRAAESALSTSPLKSSGTTAEGKKTDSAMQHEEEGAVLYHKPVKIKLKRDARDNYTWELNGDDINEILSLDRQLRTKLAQGSESRPGGQDKQATHGN